MNMREVELKHCSTPMHPVFSLTLLLHTHAVLTAHLFNSLKSLLRLVFIFTSLAWSGYELALCFVCILYICVFMCSPWCDLSLDN